MLGFFRGKGKRKENKNSQTGEYETYIEEKTSSVLSQVKGAGKVTVMVTLKSNGQKLIEKDHSGSTQTQEETSDGNVRKDSESTSEKISVYEQTADGASVPYVSKELTPEVEVTVIMQFAIWFCRNIGECGRCTGRQTDKDRDKTGRCRKAHGGDGSRDPSRPDGHRGDRRSGRKRGGRGGTGLFSGKTVRRIYEYGDHKRKINLK